MTLRTGRSLWCPKALSKQALVDQDGADKVTAITRLFLPASILYIHKFNGRTEKQTEAIAWMQNWFFNRS